MNRKLLMFALIPLVLSVMVTPAMAKRKGIGPQKVPPIGPEQWRNPNLMITDEGAELLLPSGGVHEWTANTSASYFDFMHALNASKAKIPNALNLTMADIMEMMTNATAALEAENKWGYMSQTVLYEMFIIELMAQGYTEGEAAKIAAAMAAMWPEGMYIRFVNVGK